MNLLLLNAASCQAALVQMGLQMGVRHHFFMSLKQTFPSFHACICRECATHLTRESAICVTKLLQCVANKTCAVLHPRDLAHFLSSLIVSVDLIKPLIRKSVAVACEKYAVAIVSG